jgi:hypothetical protein
MASTNEPLLVSGMRKNPTGEVRYTPGNGFGMIGTSTRGFLAELDAMTATALTVDEAHVLLDVIAHGADQAKHLSPWAQYEAGDDTDPKATREGWSQLVRDAQDKLTKIIEEA